MWKPIAIITAIVAVIMAAIIFWLARDPSQVDKQHTQTTPATQTQTAAATAKPEHENRHTQAKPPEGFCERDFDQVAAREKDVDALEQAGGLVHIFEREARLEDPYGCADFYLAHGLDIDAVDPRAEHDQLTGLFYAIQRNDPKMLHFMIDHGANLQKRAGRKDTRAMGYAYFLALQDQRIDRNQVIGILDATLTRQARHDSDVARTARD